MEIPGPTAESGIFVSQAFFLVTSWYDGKAVSDMLIDGVHVMRELVGP